MLTSDSKTTDTSSEYCDCARQSDLWRCQAQGSLCRADGKGCALLATAQETGREVWDGRAESALKTRPCGCGRPRR